MRPPRPFFRYAFLVLLFGVVPSGAQPVTAPAPAHYGAVVAEARALIHRHVVESGIPGLSIAVSVGGETVWSEGFGYADLEQRVPVWPTTRFRIGSVSKPLTATAVARLYAAGRLDVDAPVQRYVPSFPEKRYPITTRALGAHLAGIRHYRGAEFLNDRHYKTVAEGLTIFARDTLLFEPGAQYSYSSYGWNLISAVVEGASGEDFLTHMRAHVFQPLGLRHTVADHVDSLIYQRTRYYVRDDDGHLLNAPFVDNSYKWAGGGFLSTPEDLLRFANAVVLGDFLPEQARALLFTEQTTKTGEGVDYGFGWGITEDEAGRRVVAHTGGSVGGTTLLAVQPDTGVVVAAVINLSGADLDAARRVFSMFVDAAAR